MRDQKEFERKQQKECHCLLLSLRGSCRKANSHQEQLSSDHCISPQPKGEGKRREGNGDSVTLDNKGCLQENERFYPR